MSQGRITDRSEACATLVQDVNQRPLLSSSIVELINNARPETRTSFTTASTEEWHLVQAWNSNRAIPAVDKVSAKADLDDPRLDIVRHDRSEVR